MVSFGILAERISRWLPADVNCEIRPAGVSPSMDIGSGRQITECHVVIAVRPRLRERQPAVAFVDFYWIFSALFFQGRWSGF